MLIVEWRRVKNTATKDQELMVYRLCLLGAQGRIAAVQRFHADTDEEALSVARVMVKGRPQLSGFELREGGRKVGGESRKRERKT